MVFLIVNAFLAFMFRSLENLNDMSFKRNTEVELTECLCIHLIMIITQVQPNYQMKCLDQKVDKRHI